MYEYSIKHVDPGAELASQLNATAVEGWRVVTLIYRDNTPIAVLYERTLHASSPDASA
jgi:hypothetical protein